MKRLIILLFSGMMMGSALQAQDVAAGQALFTQNCTSCHAIGKQVVGPDLKNVDQQRSEQWIINFVHSSQSVIKSGDTAAVKLYDEFNKTLMPDHPQLKDADIKNIIAYIKDQSAKVKESSGLGDLPAAPPMYTTSNGSAWWHKLIFLDVNGNFHPITFHNYFFWLVLALTVTGVVWALLTAVKAAGIKNKEEQN